MSDAGNGKLTGSTRTATERNAANAAASTAVAVTPAGTATAATAIATAGNASQEPPPTKRPRWNGPAAGAGTATSTSTAGGTGATSATATAPAPAAYSPPLIPSTYTNTSRGKSRTYYRVGESKIFSSREIKLEQQGISPGHAIPIPYYPPGQKTFRYNTIAKTFIKTKPTTRTNFKKNVVRGILPNGNQENAIITFRNVTTHLTIQNVTKIFTSIMTNLFRQSMLDLAVRARDHSFEIYNNYQDYLPPSRRNPTLLDLHKESYHTLYLLNGFNYPLKTILGIQPAVDAETKNFLTKIYNTDQQRELNKYYSVILSDIWVELNKPEYPNLFIAIIFKQGYRENPGTPQERYIPGKIYIRLTNEIDATQYLKVENNTGSSIGTGGGSSRSIGTGGGAGGSSRSVGIGTATSAQSEVPAYYAATDLIGAHITMPENMSFMGGVIDSYHISDYMLDPNNPQQYFHFTGIAIPSRLGALDATAPILPGTRRDLLYMNPILKPLDDYRKNLDETNFSTLTGFDLSDAYFGGDESQIIIPLTSYLHFETKSKQRRDALPVQQPPLNDRQKDIIKQQKITEAQPRQVARQAEITRQAEIARQASMFYPQAGIFHPQAGIFHPVPQPQGRGGYPPGTPYPVPQSQGRGGNPPVMYHKHYHSVRRGGYLKKTLNRRKKYRKTRKGRK